MRSNNTERLGVYFVGHLIHKELGWIFREQPIVDVGIDALIEQMNEDQPTGKYISVQIKTGMGNFHASKDFLTLYVTNIHYNYWLNSNLPVILIAHIPETERTTWEYVCSDIFKQTATQWKIQIPNSKELNKNSIPELNNIISGTKQSVFELRIEKGEISQSDVDKIIEDSQQTKFATKSLNNITDKITKMGDITNMHTTKIKKYGALGLTEFDKRVMRSVKIYSNQINNITQQLQNDIDDFAIYYSMALHAYEKLAILVFHTTQDYNLLQEMYDSLLTMKPSINFSIESMKELRNSASGLPTKYSHLKKARLKLIEVTNQIIIEFKLADSINDSLIRTIKEKLG